MSFADSPVREAPHGADAERLRSLSSFIAQSLINQAFSLTFLKRCECDVELSCCALGITALVILSL